MRSPCEGARNISAHASRDHLPKFTANSADIPNLRAPTGGYPYKTREISASTQRFKNIVGVKPLTFLLQKRRSTNLNVARTSLADISDIGR